MNKNSVIGFILIGVVLFGFTMYQSNESRKYQEWQIAEAQRQEAEQARLDSLAAVEAEQARAARYEELAAQGKTAEEIDQILSAQAEPEQTVASTSSAAEQTIYNNPFLAASAQKAYSIKESADTASTVIIENEKVVMTLSSLGGQISSVMVKDFKTYGDSALYVIKPGEEYTRFPITVQLKENPRDVVGKWISTDNFNFDIVEQTGSSVRMRLFFDEDSYLERSYKLDEGKYSSLAEVSFINMEEYIPASTTTFQAWYKFVIPRLEKGYSSEKQYSKVNYYFSGEDDIEEMAKGNGETKTIDSQFSWFAFQQQFFSAIFRAPQHYRGELHAKYFDENDPEHRLMKCSAELTCDLAHTGNVVVPYEMYFGPNDYRVLSEYDHSYEKMIPLGGWLVGWFTKYVIIPLFNFLNGFISNYGLIILIMTLIIKGVVLPLTYKSYASSAKMRVLRPEIEKINAKYPKQEDAMKKQQATMDLYKRADVSMFGGCLPMLLTFPILWAMFRFFPASIELRQQPFLWCEDLSSYDSIVNFGGSIPLLGDHISLFALLMAVVMWAYSKFTMSQQTASNDPTAGPMKFMSVWFMPIMMFFICNNLSAALSYYYLLSQLIAIIETWAIRKFFVDGDKILAKVHASEGKPVKKSKWQLRLEEAQRIQAQQQAQQRANKRK